MEYKVEYDSLNEMYSAIKANANSWIRRLKAVRKTCERLQSSDNMSGAYADSLKLYIENTHLVILSALEELVTLLRDNCLLYKRDYRTQIDSSAHAMIKSDVLAEREEELRYQKRKAYAIVNDVQDTLNQISDIIALQLGNISGVIASHDAAIRYIQELDADICALENKHVREDFENLRASANALRQMIRQLQGKSRRYKESFPKSSYLASDSFRDVLAASLMVKGELSNKEVVIKEAQAEDDHTITVIDKESQDVPAYARELLSTLEGILKEASSFTGGIEKASGAEALSVTGSALDYLSALAGVWSGERTTSEEMVSDITSLIKSSADMEKGIYEFFEKALHPYEASKLDEKMGKMLPWLALISGLADSAGTAFETGQVYVNEDSSAYEKGAQSLKLAESVISALGKYNIAILAGGDKALRILNKVSGSSKVVNQILKQPTLEFATSAATKTKIANNTACLTIISTVLSTLSSGIERAGEVAEDGDYTLGEAIGTTGSHAGLNGLSTLTSCATLGIVNFDGEQVADNIDSKVEEFVNSDHWNAQYIRDENNPLVFRFGASIAQGAWFLGEEIVDGTVDTCNAICDATVEAGNAISSIISTGWEKLTGLF